MNGCGVWTGDEQQSTDLRVEEIAMRIEKMVQGAFGSSALTLSSWIVTRLAWAQTVAPAPSPVTPMAPSPAAGSTGAGGGVVLVGVLIALFVIIGVAVKMYDWKRKRDEEAMYLQARIADALLLDPSLAALPVAATVHAPFSRRSPVRIEVTGQVAAPTLRDAVLNIVNAEASRSGLEFSVEEHLTVRPHVHAA
jgi:hypothetical protein